MRKIVTQVSGGEWTMSGVPSPIVRIAAAFSLIVWMAFDLRLGEAETVRVTAKELENQ